MESVDYVNGKSDDSIVLNQGYKYHHKALFKGNDYIFIYNYLGDKTIINLNEYKNKEMELYLINPENNNKEYYGSFKGINVLTINPLKRNNNINDIVIVLKEKKL